MPFRMGLLVAFVLVVQIFLSRGFFQLLGKRATCLVLIENNLNRTWTELYKKKFRRNHQVDLLVNKVRGYNRRLIRIKKWVQSLTHRGHLPRINILGPKCCRGGE